MPELITAGMAMKESLDLLRPIFEKSGAPSMGTVVIGTVEGDVHDVGKNIVAMMLQGAGFKVHDLGIDVPPAKFIGGGKAIPAGHPGAFGPVHSHPSGHERDDQDHGRQRLAEKGEGDDRRGPH